MLVVTSIAVMTDAWEYGLVT